MTAKNKRKPASPLLSIKEERELMKQLSEERFTDLDEDAAWKIMCREIEGSYKICNEKIGAKYSGQHVAILKGRIVGIGFDPVKLTDEICARFGVPPERVLLRVMDNNPTIYPLR
jgi:hypothetical protein